MMPCLRAWCSCRRGGRGCTLACEHQRCALGEGHGREGVRESGWACLLSMSTGSARQRHAIPFAHHSELGVGRRVACAGGVCRGRGGRHCGRWSWWSDGSGGPRGGGGVKGALNAGWAGEMLKSHALAGCLNGGRGRVEADCQESPREQPTSTVMRSCSSSSIFPGWPYLDAPGHVTLPPAIQMAAMSCYRPPP